MQNVKMACALSDLCPASLRGLPGKVCLAAVAGVTLKSGVEHAGTSVSLPQQMQNVNMVCVSYPHFFQGPQHFAKCKCGLCIKPSLSRHFQLGQSTLAVWGALLG